LDVQRPARLCHSKHQTARTIFVFRIILYDFAIRNRIPHFANTDATQDALIGRMLRELELGLSDFLANLLDHGLLDPPALPAC